MVGKQVVHQATGVGVPWLMQKVKSVLKLTKIHDSDGILFRWEYDYTLDNDHKLYEEYNEMAMQFGFITLFSSAFPLAPLCAMINNIFEIRQDAQKYTMYNTRPIPTRVPDIGIWYSIFQFLSVLAVITNGLHIAITSTVIPRIWWAFNEESMSGFAASTFSTFNVNDFEANVGPSSEVLTGSKFENVTQCAYIGHRQRFEQDGQVSYEPTMSFWENIFARAIFFIVFEVKFKLVFKLKINFSTWC